MRIFFTLIIYIILITNAFSALVFYDDFESPYITTQIPTNGNTSGMVDTTKWIQTTTGKNANFQGLVNEVNGEFVDITGEQAYAFRYANTGITTKENTIGSLSVGQTVIVSFDVVLDNSDSGGNYSAHLVTFNGGIRYDMAANKQEAGTTSILADIHGIYNGTTYQTITFSYIVGNSMVDANGATGGTPTAFNPTLLGHDIALRFDGTSNSAIIDNVRVSIIPEPTILSIFGVGFIFILILKRKRNRDLTKY